MTCCVVTRAQGSELPYLRAFVSHYIERLGFDRVLLINCDRRDPAAFASAVRRLYPDLVTVLVPPRDVGVDDVYSRFLPDIKAYDFCLNVDVDEFLVVKEASFMDWMASVGHPRSTALPCLNIGYLGPPVASLRRMLQRGQAIPNNHVKTASVARTVKRMSCHAMSQADRSGPDVTVQWMCEGRPFPKIAHPIGERILKTTLEPFTGEIHQQRMTAGRRNDPSAVHEVDGFAFIAHFHMRGPLDLLLKATNQGFHGADRAPYAGLATLFDSKPDALAMDAVPSRFKYAFAATRIVAVPERWQQRLRDLAAARLGELPIDLDAQERSFVAGLSDAGIAPGRARAIWEQDGVTALFAALDARFGPLFEAGAVRAERDAMVGELAARFGERLFTEEKLRILTDGALRRGFEGAVSRGLSGPERIDQVVRAASASLRALLAPAEGQDAATA